MLEILSHTRQDYIIKSPINAFHAIRNYQRCNYNKEGVYTFLKWIFQRPEELLQDYDAMKLQNQITIRQFSG
jgi:hypothetical protein